MMKFSSQFSNRVFPQKMQASNVLVLKFSFTNSIKVQILFDKIGFRRRNLNLAHSLAHLNPLSKYSKTVTKTLLVLD